MMFRTATSYHAEPSGLEAEAVEKFHDGSLPNGSADYRVFALRVFASSRRLVDARRVDAWSALQLNFSTASARSPSRTDEIFLEGIMFPVSMILLLIFSSSLYAADLKAKKILDLTHSFNEQTIYWPTAKSFQHEKVSWGKTKEGYFYSSANISGSEHGGTHLDAPIHFAEKGWTSDQVPIERFVGPAVVVDVTEKCAGNPDYTLTVEDIQQWEKKNGTIPGDSIVLLRTGWDKFWPDKKKYLGDDKPGDASNLHFPAFSKEAAEFLAKQRKIKGAGLDTASLDPGTSKDFIVHQIFNGANIYGLENVANLDQLPAKGSILIALPMKIENGTGGPVRIIALVD